MCKRARLWAFIAMGALAASAAYTAEPARPGATAEKATSAKVPLQASPDQINGWIKNLDSTNFGSREQAVEKLAEAGADAVEPLKKAASGDSLEVTLNAIGVLRRLAQSDRAETKTAARGALEQLGKSDNKPLAKRAAEALAEAVKLADAKPADKETKPDDGEPAQAGGHFHNNMRRALRPNLLVLGEGGPAVTSRTESHDPDGKHTVDVELAPTANKTDNPSHVKIEESKSGIKVTVTDKTAVKDKDKVRTFEAKDVDELKQKQPEGYKFYEQYIHDGAPAAPGANGRAVLQVRPLPARIAPIEDEGADAKNLQARIAAAEKLVERAKQTAASSNEDKVKKSSEKIEAARKLLEEARKSLE